MSFRIVQIPDGMDSVVTRLSISMTPFINKYVKVPDHGRLSFVTLVMLICWLTWWCEFEASYLSVCTPMLVFFVVFVLIVFVGQSLFGMGLSNSNIVYFAQRTSILFASESVKGITCCQTF